MANRSGFPRVPDDGNTPVATHTMNGRTWSRGTDGWGNDYVLELRYAPLDTVGAHRIEFAVSDYYHVTAKGSQRIQRGELWGMLAYVQRVHGRTCVTTVDGRPVAEWQVGGEPVDELEAWLVSH